MRFWNLLALCTGALAVALPQLESTAAESRDKDHAAAIKEAFQHSWKGYKTYAWGSDELKPVSNSGSNSRNGWGASIADALSTAVLMELSDVVLEALEHLASVDFTKTATEVNLFETTIRYLGGLLSGYDLLKGPYAHLVPKGKESLVDSLLSQAAVLADRMAFAFDTPSGVPYNHLDFTGNSSSDSTNGLATTGTLVLEWTRLSDLTGDRKYADLVQKAESYLLDPQLEAGEPFPGLLGTRISVATGRFNDSMGGWSGGTDSFYEYLLKMWIYDPSKFGEYADRWLLAADSTLKHLLQTPKQVPQSAAFVAEYNNATSLNQFEGHLTCFIGGNLMLGGELLDRADIKDAGLALTEGCRHTYTSSPAGIGPERWSWDPNNVPDTLTPFYAKNGYYPTTPTYDLRPEVIESYYHALELTGDAKYKNWAWEAFVAINASCRTASGYSSISDVMSAPGSSPKSDFQESFWFAEVLKYLWLTFAGGQVNTVGGEWVFNTEAHPLKVAGYRL